LMMRASREAQIAHAPNVRPMVVTRSGAVGMHRYAQTWSGDNTTAWKTLRWNSRMGLGLSLSGVSNFGHDIGGFAGPRPDRELFLRWVAAGVLLPRFSIHSWNDDGSANEPWMHPEAVGAVRDLLGLRHRLTPYLKECLRRYAEDYEPALRPVWATFPDEPTTRDDGDTVMLGADLLAAPAFDAGVTQVETILPRGADWQDWWTGRRFAAGRTISLEAPLDRTPLLVRAGAVIPLNLAPAHFGRHEFARGARIAAPEVGAIGGGWVEDDGEHIDGPSAAWRVEGEADGRGITLSVSVSGPLETDRRVTLVLPVAERRPVAVTSGRIVGEREVAGERWIEVMAP